MNTAAMRLKLFLSRTEVHAMKALDTINAMTGFKAVEERKLSVQLKDEQLHQKKEEFNMVKSEYEAIIEERRQNQKDLDSVRDRKTTMQDIGRITDLYKRQLSLEAGEKEAKELYRLATHAFDQAQMQYLNEMRERYIEEQMYSDKIRAASTWWTWGLISTHLVLFLTIQFIVEPRKKKDLKDQLVEIVKEGRDLDRLALKEIVSSLTAASSNTTQQKAGKSLLADVISPSAPKPDANKALSKSPQPPLLTEGREGVQDQMEFIQEPDYWKGMGLGVILSLLLARSLP